MKRYRIPLQNLPGMTDNVIEKKVLEIGQEIQQEFYRVLNENMEYTRRHHPYEQEMREQGAIMNGDVDMLLRSWKEVHEGFISPQASDPLRSIKNTAIIVGSGSCRVAILGGVLPEVAFTLCDTFIHRLEEVEEPELVIPLLRLIQYQYAMMVQEAKGKVRTNGPQLDVRVERAKAYIFEHLHEKISLADVADALNMNPHTLTALFRRKEGTSIGEFILEEKMRIVKGELIYTNRTYSEIATYLGYANQSHLGSVFKRQAGMTLHQYRMAYSALAQTK